MKRQRVDNSLIDHKWMICPITTLPMLHPVIMKQCGCIFEKEAISSRKC